MKEQSPKIDWRSKFTKDQIFTIPNLLSFFRIVLIPFIIWLYCIEQPFWALALIIVSGITDVVDGFIARKFNMVTDFGKAIDPITDKLTQGIILIALLTRFPFMWVPLGIMVVKEATAFTLRFIIFKKTEKVDSAEWHGKLNTIVLYLVMTLHIVWYEIPATISTVCILISTAIMVLSFVLYTVETVMILKKNSQK